MLIEQLAYANRWRNVSPAAKGIFAASGLLAAFAATSPAGGLLVAGLLVASSLLGAGIAPGHYLRVAAPPLFFLAAGSLSLVFSLDIASGGPVLQMLPSGSGRLAEVAARSLGALAALLFLALSTPLADLIALLRRLQAPPLLLDLMVLCYRTLFVFSAAVRETLTAQSARLGYASPCLAMRSLGQLVANLTMQIWQRAQALNRAALARNNDGPLRFIEPVFAHAGRDCGLAVLAGAALLALARLLK